MPTDPALTKLFKDALSRQAAGDAGGALIAYKRVQRQFPDFPDAWVNAALLLCDMDRHEEAIWQSERALELDGGSWPAAHARAHAQRKIGMAAEAEAGLSALLEADPAHRPAILTLAGFRAEDGRFAESMELFDRASRLEPLRGDPLVMRGVARMWAVDLPGAEADFRAALASGADGDHVRMNLAISLLIQGRYREAWPLFGSTMALGDIFEKASGRWDGRPLRGGDLLVRTYPHGFGDVVMFARLLPMARERAGGRLLLSVYEPMLRLARGLPGVDGVTVQEKDDPPLGPLGAITNILELPVLLSVDPAATPPPTALRLPPSMADAPAPPELLRPGLKVGLVWAGNPVHTGDAKRSMDPRLLDALADVEGVAWYGLQVPPAPDPPRLPGFTDLSGLFGDFLDTAQAVRHLDLVASVDTSVLHLAATLGVPTLALITHTPEWRWGLGETTHWYPAARLIRQPRMGDWPGAVERLKAEIATRAALVGARG
jgi:tetratricopeptide (TPR) repeat protein